MFNQAGRLVKKKKTIVQEDTKDPVFNETLNFEMTAAQLETARFLVAVFTRQRGQTRMEEVEEQTGLQEGEDMEQSAEQNNRLHLFNLFKPMMLTQAGLYRSGARPVSWAGVAGTQCGLRAGQGALQVRPGDAQAGLQHESHPRLTPTDTTHKTIIVFALNQRKLYLLATIL